ncbi:TMEM62 isoform 2 [Pan troglodytes]|uniref:TMEM62 isoform 2 n=1 Tax=Pan troglodytes TaxID=9598 RepID=A0A2J8QEA9_PANTR|nr:TMEM62 isoform 2 [Pan troglodytes]
MEKTKWLDIKGNHGNILLYVEMALSIMSTVRPLATIRSSV